MRRAARITVVTSGHLSTCPRMLKAADALAADGHKVRVVATVHEPWAVEADRDVRSRRPSWSLARVDYRRDGDSITYWRSGIRYHTARRLVSAFGAKRMSLAVVARAFGRVHTELVRAIAAEPADFVYGGTTGALAATAEAAQRLGTRYALDLEDFHSGEIDGRDGPLTHELATHIESNVLQRATFLTAGSAAIAGAYRDRYGVRPAVLNNTFPLPGRAPDAPRARAGQLRLYWFSQTIGPGRGLEDAVAAMGLAGLEGELSVRGRAIPGYIEQLQRSAADLAPRLRVVPLPPAPPDAMIDLARGYDVGLALEQTAVPNRRLCLTNKAFTYILAGVAVAMTDTAGQHDLGVDLGPAAGLVPPGDVAALSTVLARWAHDSSSLACAQRAAWDAARRRWHWEHDDERGRLSRLVSEALR